MSEVPYNFRNVICPWQTPKEIRLQSRFAKRIWDKSSPEEQIELFRLKEERKW